MLLKDLSILNRAIKVNNLKYSWSFTAFHVILLLTYYNENKPLTNLYLKKYFNHYSPLYVVKQIKSLVKMGHITRVDIHKPAILTDKGKQFINTFLEIYLQTIKKAGLPTDYINNLFKE